MSLVTEQQAHAGKGWKDPRSNAKYHSGQEADGQSMTRSPPDSLRVFNRSSPDTKRGRNDRPHVCQPYKDREACVHPFDLCWTLWRLEQPQRIHSRNHSGEQ